MGIAWKEQLTLSYYQERILSWERILNRECVLNPLEIVKDFLLFNQLFSIKLLSWMELFVTKNGTGDRNVLD